MPVQIQCISVVIRNEALDRCLDGGSSNFASIAPNAMSYSDDRLSQASFMSHVDAENFTKELELRGLTRDSSNPEFVVVTSHDQNVTPACQWLLLFEYDNRLIATVRGSESRKVIAPAAEGMNNPNSIRHLSPEEMEQRLEFVERKENIDTYRDKVTGELLYHTRKTLSDKEVFQAAFDTTFKNRRVPGDPVNPQVATTIRETITKLQGLAARNPDSFEVALAQGIAWFTINELDRAEQSFQRAASIEPENTIVLKEWGGLCLETQNWKKAVSLSRRAVTIKPDDIELLGNLATSQLLANLVDDSHQTINHAIALNPSDSVNRSVQKIIQSVINGKCSRPETLQQMMEPRRLSLLERIFAAIGFR